MINDLNGSFGSWYFLYVMNERTSFASWVSAFESSRLVIGLKWTSDQKVTYVFVTFEWSKWGCDKIESVFESFWSNLKFLNDRFNRVVVRVKCESEWNAVRSVFLLSRLWCWLSIYLLGTVMARLNDRNRIATFIEKLSEKLESSLHKQRSLRNCEKGMEFLTCDRCEDKYNK